jgi:ABC-type glycerol-3-phosphate transport system substrate-binding protein
MTKKVLSLILAVLMLLPMAVACAETPTEDATTSADPTLTTAPPSNTEVPEETELASKTLPADLKFNGETVTILSRDASFVSDEIWVDDLNGAMVNDAIYKRNAKVMEQLNVSIESIQLSGDAYAVSTELRNAASNGEAYFDIAANSTYSTIMYTSENIFLDLTECDYLDLDAIYWSQGYNESASIGNSQYLATGALALSLYRLMFITFYNKTLLAEAQYENLYTVVDEGRWTLDYQIQLSKDLYKDADGSGTVSEGDTVGFASSTLSYLDPYWSSCDIQIITKDADNHFVYSLDSEKLSNTIDKLIVLFHQSNAWFDRSSGDDGKQTAMSNLFTSGNVGTATLRLGSVETEQFISMQDEYGIIPMPKYDENQEKYYTFLHDQFTSIGISSVHSSDEEKVQMLGAVLEAMALESYKTVIPAYYEVALKGRYLDDSDSWRMLDMIYENVKVDAGVLYTKNLGSIHQTPRDMIDTGKNAITSLLKAINRQIEKQFLPKLLNELLALE